MSPHPRTSSPVSQSSLKSFEALVVAAGIDPEGFFKQLRSDLALLSDPVLAVNNLHRFLSSGFTTSILRDFQAHPVLQRLILELFAQSQYLADILVRDPELFRWLTTTNALKIAKSRSDYRSEALAAAQLFSRMEKRFDSLKRFHRREMLRIGARDILKEADVVVITQELSALADAVVQSVLEIGQNDLAGRTGADFKNTLGVIGLGKLGGDELNFSSDIDLLFVYDQDGEFHAPQERIRTFHEYYTKLAEFVVRRLTEFTGEGHLYRVDMRLRPEGSAGPLALSRAAYMLYYETRGELWERQMLLKARPIAGNAEVAQRLLDDLQPFIVPKTFFSSPLEEMGRMKHRIESRTDTAGNIKLGEGGIRDIEFVVQALQLLSGGGNKVVRMSNTLAALEQLYESGKISTKDQRSLAEAYKFLRVVEHRLQLLHGMQTHSIPGSRAETDLLAKRLGYRTTSRFGEEIDSHRKRVRKIFAALFGEPQRGFQGGAAKGGANPIRTGIALRGLRLIDESKTMESVERFTSHLSPLREEVVWKSFVQALRKHEAPDLAVQNLVLLAESAPIRRTLVQALGNPDLMDLLVLICSRSRRLSMTLSREPLLFESLVGQPEEVFGDGWGWGLMKENDLARYRAYNEFKILLGFIVGQWSIEMVTARLSDLAQHIVTEVLDAMGVPSGMAVVALGKFGGREMTVGSDADCLFLYDEDSVKAPDAENAAKLLVGELASSKVYDIDFRLRPEGKSAPLATGLRYYRDYLTTRASLWERQSLTKARVVWGEQSLTARILENISEAAYDRPLPSGWTQEVRSMRERIEQERVSRSGTGSDLKVGKGGLVDLEFTIQVLQLRFGGENRRLRTANSFQALDILKERGLMRSAEARRARMNLRLFRTLETFIRLNAEHADFVLPADVLVLKALAAGTGEKSVQMLKSRIQSIRTENQRLLRDALKLAAKK